MQQTVCGACRQRRESCIAYCKKRLYKAQEEREALVSRDYAVRNVNHVVCCEQRKERQQPPAPFFSGQEQVGCREKKRWKEIVLQVNVEKVRRYVLSEVVSGKNKEFVNKAEYYCGKET